MDDKVKKYKEKLSDLFWGVPVWVWLAAIILFVIVVLFIIGALVAEIGLGNVNYIILVLAAVVASPFGIWRMTMTHRQTDIQQQSVHTDSYFKAIDQLKHENTPIRSGAIYGLENIARASEDHHLQIVELLCSYIRAKAKATEDKSKKQDDNNLAIDIQLAKELGFDTPAVKELMIDIQELAIDIQAALDVLGRRSEKWIEEIESPKKFRMKLQRIHIKEANLVELNFKGADLRGAHLEGANLYKAHLEGADLRRAHLEVANLIDVHLKHADLWKARLEYAILIGAHLEGARLSEAHLKGAHLWGADLEGVKNLTQAQIDSTFGDKATTLPQDLDRFRPKHWPENRALSEREIIEEWIKWQRDPENYQPPQE